MIHINEKLKQTPLFLLDLFIPEYYVAQTIKDFIRNRKNIKPTKKLIPLGIFFYNSTAIEFPSVIFNFINEDEETGLISDLNDSLQVRIAPHLDDSLEEGARLYEPMISFNTKNEAILLFSYRENGPIIKSRNRLRFTFDKLKDLVYT